MSESKGRASRLRAAAVIVVIAGVALGFLVGAAFPAAVTRQGFSKITSYTTTTDGGDGGFNVLFTVLVAGPCLVAAAFLYGCSEIVAGLRRSARTRSSEGGGRDVATTV